MKNFLMGIIVIMPLISWAENIDHTLDILEKDLDRIRTLSATFTQKNSDGTFFKGTMFLKRPGHIKFLYDTPKGMVIVSDGEHLIYFDPIAYQTSYLSIENSPAQLLLDSKLNFKEHASLISFKEGCDVITVVLKTHKTRQYITLFIGVKDKVLKGWTTKDPQGHEVTLTLSNIVQNPEFYDKTLFLFKKPKRTKKKL